MERLLKHARALVPLIRHCFCGDEDSTVVDLENREAQVIRVLSPITQDIRLVGVEHQSSFVPESPNEPESQNIDSIEERLTTSHSVEQGYDLVHSILGSPNLHWFRHQYSTTNVVTTESQVIGDLIAGSGTNEESENAQQQRVADVSVNIEDAEDETTSRSVKNFFRVITCFCVAPHDITTASKIESKWGIIQKVAFVAVICLALLSPLSYLKDRYMDTRSSKTSVIRYASLTIQLVTICTYLVTHTYRPGEVRSFLDGLSGEISSMYFLLPVSAMIQALVAALFGRSFGNLSKWNLEEEYESQIYYTKEFFLQWGTGNYTQDLSDKWTELDNAFGVIGFLSIYAAYYLDYFIQDTFLVIAVVFSAYPKLFINDMKKVLEANSGNRNDAVKDLVRKYEKLQEKKKAFNMAFGGLFDCFHFRNLFRCVYFVFAMLEKLDYQDLAFYSISTTKPWIVYYLASKATDLNGEFRYLISTNLETFIDAVGDTKVNFLLNDILVNPVGLGDGVSFVDRRFIYELISMIATYVVILVTNKD